MPARLRQNSQNDKGLAQSIIANFLNLGWSLLGFVIGIISLPIKIRFERIAGIFILDVKRLWLGEIFLGRRIKGQAFGKVVLLSEAKDEFTLGHELAHVRQYDRMPLIFPLLYCLEIIRNGYSRNRYEEEARQYEIN